MKNSEQKIDSGLTFLAEFDWIHNFQVTNIFKKESLNKIPSEWLSHLQKLTMDELNELPFIETAVKDKYPDWPASLHNFICRASALSLDREQTRDVAPTAVDSRMAKGMIPKKLHEVLWMASLVNDFMNKTNCNLVVDIGSGLGYLDHVLHQVYGHQVLGLEISESHACAAESRAFNQGLTCSGVRSMKLNITDDEECFHKFDSIINNFPPFQFCNHSLKGAENAEGRSGSAFPTVCLIGLHCCGDLSSAVLSMFHNINSIRAVCCVCCCYHKMAFTDGRFPKFPMSSTGQKCYQDVLVQCPSWQISPYTLRLGAQETRSRWRAQSTEEHRDHTRHVIYRGLLEIIGFGDSETVRKRVRKCDFSTFDTFLQTFFPMVTLTEGTTGVKESKMAALRKLHDEHLKEFELIEIFSCLQVIVQPVIEALIYRDRAHWLMEKDYTDVQVVPIFDEIISPRNLAILAAKPSLPVE